jgi:hypothetical protein
MILASRYRIRSELSKSRSLEQSKLYAELGSTALWIEAADHLDSSVRMAMPIPISDNMLNWYGNANGHTTPSNYLALRSDFHCAASGANWVEVWNIIAGNYEWGVTEWFTLPSSKEPWTGRTLLHEMADYGPPSSEDKVN